mmetsp:Transcript_43591/g.113543  ORF Transcript_43591/g.113543 Transcript_43591/m.113543 type:complete len:129 (+) Transcript_43591:2033-2419(+)
MGEKTGSKVRVWMRTDKRQGVTARLCTPLVLVGVGMTFRRQEGKEREGGVTDIHPDCLSRAYTLTCLLFPLLVACLFSSFLLGFRKTVLHLETPVHYHTCTNTSSLPSISLTWSPRVVRAHVRVLIII